MQVVHCFEQSGLGQAPYTYLGCQDLGRCAASCQHCGTGIRYKFHLQSADGKQFFVGSDCIYRSGDAGLTNIAKRERTRIAKEQRDAKKLAKAQERQAQREKTQKERFDNFVAAHADLVPVLDWAKSAGGVAQNIYNNLEQWGTLSDRQIEFITRLHVESQNAPVKSACPTGKVTIEGTIVGIKWAQTQFGSQEKMIVESNGFKVYGSVPKSLDGVVKGNKVRFVATVEQSRDDESFGFFSRPTQAVCMQ
jgi:hypothetical protein